MPRIWIVTTTLPDEDGARRLARALIEERLAACAQVDAPMRSFYVWEGRLEEDREARLVLKVPEAGLGALLDAVRARHPYEVPQLLWWPADSDAAYARWAGSVVREARS